MFLSAVRLFFAGGMFGMFKGNRSYSISGWSLSKIVEIYWIKKQNAKLVSSLNKNTNLILKKIPVYIYLDLLL